MNTLSKTAITAMAAVTVSIGAAFIASAPSQAAGFSNPAPLAQTAPVQTALQGEAQIIKVGGRRHRHRGHRRHRGHFGIYIGHGGYYDRPYYRDCFWKKKRRWSSYRGRYVYRKVRVCY